MFILYYSYGKRYRYKYFDSYDFMINFIKKNKSRFYDFTIYSQLRLFDDELFSLMNNNVKSKYSSQYLK